MTHHVDHAATARSESNRVASGWFGKGDSLKNRAASLLDAYAEQYHMPGNMRIEYDDLRESQAMTAAEEMVETVDGSGLLSQFLGRPVSLRDIEQPTA